MAIAFVLTALAACGKSEEKKIDAAPQPAGDPAVQAQTRIYGKADAECFAGIVRASDKKHFTRDDFVKWKDKLGDKDKDWLSGFSVFYSTVTRVVTSHMGRTSKELYESNLITLQQLDVIEGYVNIYQESDAAKADSLAAAACAKVGFTKGLNLD